MQLSKFIYHLLEKIILNDFTRIRFLQVLKFIDFVCNKYRYMNKYMGNDQKKGTIHHHVLVNCTKKHHNILNISREKIMTENS